MFASNLPTEMSAAIDLDSFFLIERILYLVWNIFKYFFKKYDSILFSSFAVRL